MCRCGRAGKRGTPSTLESTPSTLGTTPSTLESTPSTLRPQVQGNNLHLTSLDLIDGTPVLDVKPYVTYDALPPAALRVPGWSGPPPPPC